MAVDALNPCSTRSSASMVLAMQDICVLVFHEERFQLPVMKNYRNCKYISFVSKIISVRHGFMTQLFFADFTHPSTQHTITLPLGVLVAIIVGIALVIGVLILTIGLVCLKRWASGWLRNPIDAIRQFSFRSVMHFHFFRIFFSNALQVCFFFIFSVAHCRVCLPLLCILQVCLWYCVCVMKTV